MPEEQSIEHLTASLPPINQGMSDEFSKWQLWGEDLIEQLKHDLRGEVESMDENNKLIWTIPDGVEPLLNENGISKTTALLRNVAFNKFTLLSELDKETIYKMLLEISNELTFLYLYEFKAYGIKSPIHASYIVTKIFYAMHNAFMMAAFGGMRDYLKTQVREIRSYKEHETDKKGIVGNVKSLFARGG